MKEKKIEKLIKMIYKENNLKEKVKLAEEVVKIKKQILAEKGEL